MWVILLGPALVPCTPACILLAVSLVSLAPALVPCTQAGILLALSLVSLAPAGILLAPALAKLRIFTIHKLFKKLPRILRAV